MSSVNFSKNELPMDTEGEVGDLFSPQDIRHFEKHGKVIQQLKGSEHIISFRPIRGRLKEEKSIQEVDVKSV